jgi:uncharacterized DUF497 family protein
MALIISPAVKAKLADKHGVSEDDVRQCFANRAPKLLEDNRADHKTNPPTQWFIAETDQGVELKVCFVLERGNIYLKTAYRPNNEERRIYTESLRSET